MGVGRHGNYIREPRMVSVVERSQSTVFRLDYEDSNDARVVTRSLREEIGEINDERSATALRRDDRTVIIRIDASDLVALRAAMNTWLSLASVAEESISVAETSDMQE